MAQHSNTLNIRTLWLWQPMRFRTALALALDLTKRVIAWSNSGQGLGQGLGLGIIFSILKSSYPNNISDIDALNFSIEYRSRTIRGPVFL